MDSLFAMMGLTPPSSAPGAPGAPGAAPAPPLPPNLPASAAVPALMRRLVMPRQLPPAARAALGLRDACGLLIHGVSTAPPALVARSALARHVAGQLHAADVVVADCDRLCRAAAERAREALAARGGEVRPEDREALLQEEIEKEIIATLAPLLTVTNATADSNKADMSSRTAGEPSVAADATAAKPDSAERIESAAVTEQPCQFSYSAPKVVILDNIDAIGHVRGPPASQSQSTNNSNGNSNSKREVYRAGDAVVGYLLTALDGPAAGDVTAVGDRARNATIARSNGTHRDESSGESAGNASAGALVVIGIMHGCGSAGGAVEARLDSALLRPGRLELRSEV